MPGSFGGLMRFKEEYESKIQFSPTQVIVGVVLVIAFSICLRIFWPITAAAA